MAKPMPQWNEICKPAVVACLTRRLLPLLTALLLTGCAGVLESNKPAREVYLLQPPDGDSSSVVTGPVKLVLSLITVPGLDTDDIQVLGPNARLIPVANAHWADNLPEVMSSLSRRTLMDSGLFQSVELGDLARPDDWQLQLELQAFYGVQNNAGATTSVLMQLEGTLRCGDNSDVFKLESSKSAGSGSLTEIVAAHQRVLNETLQALPGRIQQACKPA